MPRLPISKKLPLREVLAGIPRMPSGSIRQGFEILSELSGENAQRILDIIIEELHKGDLRLKPDSIARELQLSEEDAQLVALAVAVAAATLSPRDDTATDFVEAAVEAKLLKQEHSDRAMDLAKTIISQKDTVQEAMERQSLASEVLPSLVSCNLTIDLRIGIENRQIKRVVPIAIVHVDTDSYQQEIWFQASKPQVESLVDQLREVLEDMEKVEAWSKMPPEQD